MDAPISGGSRHPPRQQRRRRPRSSTTALTKRRGWARSATAAGLAAVAAAVAAVAVVASSLVVGVGAYEPPQPFGGGRPPRGMQGGVADVGAEALVDEFGTLLAPAANGEWVGDADTYAAAVRRAVLDFNATSAAESGNYDPFYPACPIYDAANSMGVGNACRFMRFMKDLLVSAPAVFRHPLAGPFPASPFDEGFVPPPFAEDLRGKAPRMLDFRAFHAEKPTWHFLFRLILRIYKHTYEVQDAMDANEPPPGLPDALAGPAWGDQRLFWMEYPIISPFTFNPTRRFRLTPFALSWVNGDRMLLVFRGTVWREEWNRDFHYSYAQDPLHDAIFGGDGHVHEGCFDVFKMLQRDITEEVMKHQPKHLMIAGHSLGGTQALLHGYHLQKLLSEIDPDIRVDVLTVGAPMFADQRFMDATAARLNQRNIVYVGDGAGGSWDEYRVGDPIPDYIGCAGIGTGPTGARWPYARAPALVPFTARDLAPNTNRWYEAENMYVTGDLPVPSMRNIASVHICSYACFLTRGTEDDLSLCFFEDQAGPLKLPPEERLCHFPDIPM